MDTFKTTTSLTMSIVNRKVLEGHVDTRNDAAVYR